MTDQNLLLSEDGYPNAPADIKQALRDARNHAAVAHIEQMERELAEARKDAERYRWLVYADWFDDEIMRSAGIRQGISSTVDDAVDAAMKDKP